VTEETVSQEKRRNGGRTEISDGCKVVRLAAEGGLPRREGTPIQTAQKIVGGLYRHSLTSRLTARFARRQSNDPSFVSVSSFLL